MIYRATRIVIGLAVSCSLLVAMLWCADAPPGLAPYRVFLLGIVATFYGISLSIPFGKRGGQ